MKKIILIMMIMAPVAAFCQPEKDRQPERTSTGEKSSSASLKSYSRYDFIPGERIAYAEDFSQDVIGELPLRWTTNNRGETVAIETLAGKWMRLFPGSRFASPSFEKLPENFTVEMDLLVQFDGEGGYVYPELELKLLELEGGAGTRSFVVNQDAANEVALVLLPGGAEKPMTASLKSYSKGAGYFSNDPKELKLASDNGGKIIHVSIWVQKERVRYWINENKIFDIPQAIPSKVNFNHIGFSVESSIYEESQLGLFISNIKVAEGTPDLRNKLLSEGRLVTHGILFDVNSDRIKPESAGVLKEIAEILKENTEINVKIVGHTDSDGETGKNLELSRRRSEAVKNALSNEFGINAARLQTDGMGESKPLADNNSREGKAKNRRVEFIKQ